MNAELETPDQFYVPDSGGGLAGPIRKVVGTPVFDPAGMRRRKTAFFRQVQSRAASFFTPEGTFRREVEPDHRITFWMLPALLAAEDPEIRLMALRLYANDPSWTEWNIFQTSSIAVNLMRERALLTPELISRSEEHLGKFCRVEGGRKPCSASNDYMFHGANDNMPSMATRSLVFAGELLGRQDLLDHGLFLLEGLCAHFQRRGLLGEYNSSTYSPISVAALMDVAECSGNLDAAEMAEACANRALLDVVAHWHQRIGAPSGSSSRCYLPDHTITLSTQNALMWYLGFPNTINPIRELDGSYDGPLHHGPGEAHVIAAQTECFSPDFSRVRRGIIKFARTERSYPYEVRAVMDSIKTTSVQIRTWQQPEWSLGTASGEMWPLQSGQHVTLRGTLLRGGEADNWRNRVACWHYLQSGPIDWGDEVPAYHGLNAPTTAVSDYGQYHTLQHRGSAMVLGHLGTSLLGKEVESLKFVFLASIFGCLPDEMLVNDSDLKQWSGEGTSDDWHFLRFGSVFAGIRASGMFEGKALPVRRVLKDGYLRLELPVINGGRRIVTSELRKDLDFAYVMEMASVDECSFAEFRRQCIKGKWECYRAFYRNSRYQGRHGELQIVDSIDPEGVRFMAVDGQTEPATFFQASGMDSSLLELFEDGRKVRQRRIVHDFDFVGSPFYPVREHVLARDTQPDNVPS